MPLPLTTVKQHIDWSDKQGYQSKQQKWYDASGNQYKPISFTPT